MLSLASHCRNLSALSITELGLPPRSLDPESAPLPVHMQGSLKYFNRGGEGERLPCCSSSPLSSEHGSHTQDMGLHGIRGVQMAGEPRLSICLVTALLRASGWL